MESIKLFSNQIELIFSQIFSFGFLSKSFHRQGLREGFQGVHRTRARAQGARKSSGFRVKFWYRTIAP